MLALQVATFLGARGKYRWLSKEYDRMPLERKNKSVNVKRNLI